MECLSENALQAAAERGGLMGDAALLRHLDECAACRDLLAEAVRARASTTMTDSGLQATPARAPLPGRPLPEGAEVGRYRVLRLLGAGAMGAVYAAHDPQLDRQVALKLLRPDAVSASAASLQQRLLREARAMARLRHPNVASVHDAGVHEGQAFLALELVEGRTLREWLREAPRPWREVLDVFLRAGDGLSAAHAAGVVHRDFKPDNVLLDAQGQPRVVDFGLARALSEAAAEEGGRGKPLLRDAAAAPEAAPGAEHDGVSRLTQTGAMVGTPAYMAPEQWGGGAVDARADAFAFAVALYEGLYGERPYAGATVAELRGALLRGEVRPAPRGSRVPRALRRVLLTALRTEPARRHGSLAELLHELRAARASARWRKALVAVPALLLAAAGAALLLRPAPAATGRRTVAVYALRSGTEAGPAWQAVALSEMLNAELGAGGQLRAVPLDDVARARADLALGDALPDGAGLQRLQRRLGADQAVSGAVAVEDGKLRLDLALTDLRSGKALVQIRDEAPEADLVPLAARAAAEVRRALGAAAPAADEAAGASAAIPARPEAARAFAEGLQRLRAMDATGAVTALERAAAAAPDHPLVHAALARALSTLGRDRLARAEAEKAAGLAGSLRRAQRLEIEALAAEMSRQWSKAVEIHRALLTFYPDDLEYGVRLSRAQVSAGQPAAALATLERLRKQPGAAADPRLDFAESTAALALSDGKRALATAQRAAAAAQAQGARLLVAQALLDQASAHSKLGDLKAAVAAGRSARALFHELGEAAAEVNASMNLGWNLTQSGDVEGARRVLEEALALARSLGYERGEAGLLGNLAIVHARRLDLPAAIAANERTLELAALLGDKATQGRTLHNLASALSELGDVAGARRRLEESAALRRAMGDKQGLSRSLGNLGMILLDMGDIDGAEKAVREALALAEENRNDLTAATYRVSLADVLLARGQLQQAEPLLRTSAEQHHKAHRTAYEATALALLAEAQLRAGKEQQALRTVAQAQALVAGSGNRTTADYVELVASRVQSVAGDPAQRASALRVLEQAVERLGKASAIELQMRARLFAGLALRKAGSPQARARLVELAADADRRGYRLIARDARAAAK